MLTGFLAPQDLEASLREELPQAQQYGRLFVVEGTPSDIHWVQNIWYDVQVLSFTSIRDAVQKLRALQKLWAYYPYKEVRRGQLIVNELPFFSPKKLLFPRSLPTAPLGSFTLLDKHTLMASACCSSSFAHGEPHFQETKIPPSRAYLKLWELFTLKQIRPEPGELCLEIGASPGSWTWVLHACKAHVVAVDKAPLDPKISRLKGVTFIPGDGFSYTPEILRPDWIFSDVICYPERLLKWIQPWLELSVNLVCTLKFQGKEHYGILREFEKIPGCQIFHLYHNKHELTWVRKKDGNKSM